MIGFGMVWDTKYSSSDHDQPPLERARAYDLCQLVCSLILLRQFILDSATLERGSLTESVN